MYRRAPRGFSLIDVIVGITLLVLLFLALFSTLRVSLILSTSAKEEAAANNLAQSQMEYLRGISYNSLGTVGGIPAGSVPQTATSTVDGVQYTMYTFIEYYDNPADFTGEDFYKIGRVTVSYFFGGQNRSISLLSNFVPPTLENTTGGGTIEIDTVNAQGVGVSGATVQIINASTSPTVNDTTYSDSSGIVYLIGAATSSQYQVYVSKSGYSSAQTYARTPENPNPNPGYLTVSANQTTNATFAIDLLTSFTVSTLSPATTTSFVDTFTNGTEIATSTNMLIGGGELALATGTSTGSALGSPFAPANLSTWGSVFANITAPASTTASVSVYDGSGNLLPDSVLPGNSSGFTSFPVSLASLSTTTYPSLALGTTLTSVNENLPYLSQWSLSAIAGPTPLPNVSLTLTGAKTIGTNASGGPIYKNIISTSTGSSASNTLSLEWDDYQLQVAGYDVTDACVPPPYALLPGESSSTALYLGTATPNSLLVSVESDTGIPVGGASVNLAGGSYNQTVPTSSCGNAYFGNVPSGSYIISISASGYTPTNFPNTAVSGQTYYVAAFP